MEQYELVEHGIIHQKDAVKIKYNYEYSDKYNNYGEKANYLSYLRLGILLSHLQEDKPTSILDVGYGNGSFLDAAKNAIPHCYGFDVSDYPVGEGITRMETMFDRHYDVVCFFDSLEHFDDIHFIDRLDCNYIFISVPWCHHFSEEWFQNWYHRRPNEHLWHFNDVALTSFFQKYGFEKVYLGNFEDTIRKNPTVAPHSNILSGIFKKNNI
jgi:hypothetical protein